MATLPCEKQFTPIFSAIVVNCDAFFVRENEFWAQAKTFRSQMS